MSTKLQNDFEVLDPMTNPSDFSHLTKEQIQEMEMNFLKGWERALRKANYKPLSQERVIIQIHLILKIHEFLARICITRRLLEHITN